MIVEAQVTIDGTKEAIWAQATDIANAAEFIEGIDKVEILERPTSGLVGLRWRETRTVMGKTATEEMWVAEAVENEFYNVRAESHGFIYTSTVRISEQNGSNTLNMTHQSAPKSFMAKVLSVPVALALKGVMRKAFLGDLNGIKAAVEGKAVGVRAG